MNGLLTLYKYLRFGGSTYSCLVCGHGVRKFFRLSYQIESTAKSYGFSHDFRNMETLNFDQCNCPFCLASDRERLYAIFLEGNFSRQGNKACRMLDFAPGASFERFMRRKTFVQYTTADFMRHDVDIEMDVCDMNQIQDYSFDIVLCSHVLEHVADPDNAMREIKRVMKKDGLAIIMVPIFKDVEETVEESQYDTPELRWRHYGQGDHVRLFSKADFLHRLQEAGLLVEAINPTGLDAELVKSNAIADNSILYVCRK